MTGRHSLPVLHDLLDKNGKLGNLLAYEILAKLDLSPQLLLETQNCVL
jgi:hypothetical protein